MSQMSLYEAAGPPTSLTKQMLMQKQAPSTNCNTQHFIHTALNEPQVRLQPSAAAAAPPPPTVSNPSSSASPHGNNTNYVQLQAQQLLKLPTIKEYHQHHLLKKLASGKTNKDASGSGHKLKFTKVLSLSAQSLSNRLGVGGGGGSGSGKKSKGKCNGGMSSNTASPGRHVSTAPMYTPPPTRRCNTMHHTPQVRKTFKTLQQLERQKLEARRALGGGGGGGGELQVTRTLHRIAGTHKTYWKYGINSTANSIVQQQQQQQIKQQQQQHHQLQQQRPSLLKHRSLTSDLESYTSDELDSDEITARIKDLEIDQSPEPPTLNLQASEEEALGDFDDSATDVGSCTVPLASDSIEMMNLMLSAAQTAVITQPPQQSPAASTASASASASPPPPPDITVTDAFNARLSNTATKANAAAAAAAAASFAVGINDSSHFPKYFTLGHRHYSSYASEHEDGEGPEGDEYERGGIFSPSPLDFLAGYHPPQIHGEEETVAYTAFHKLSRRKSFSGEKMRGHSLQRNVKAIYSDTDSSNVNQQASPVNVDVVADDAVNNRVLARNVTPGSNRHLSRNYVNNNRSLLKSSSLDVPHSGSISAAIPYPMDFNISNNTHTTIITANPLITHLKNSSSHKTQSQSASQSQSSTSTNAKQLKTSQQVKQKLLTPAALIFSGTSVPSSGLHLKDINSRSPMAASRSSNQQQQQQQQLQQLSPASMVCSTDDELVAYQQHLSQQFHQHQHLLQDQQQTTTQHPAQHGHAHPHTRMAFDLCANGDLCTAGMASSLIIDDELEEHIKQCSCSCNHMGYGNSMDYQTTGFGGLPDVTEHSNIRRTISRQNSTSNSDSGGEIASIQKSKVNFNNDTKSPSDVSDPIAVDTSAKAKRKSKASQQHGGHAAMVGGQHKMTGRNSCVIALTLVVALSLLAVAATLLYQHFVMADSRNSHTQRLKIVKRILRDVPLVDGHNNFAWNVRKYAHSSLELVHVSNDINHKSMWVRPAWAQTDMERLKMGQVGVQVWSAYVPCEAQGLDAVQLALEQIDIIRRLTDMYHQDTVLVQSSKDIQMAQRQGLISSLIGIEGGHAIGSSLGVLRSFYSLGARYLSLTHKCDVSWAGSSSTAIDAGLSQFGKAIIREMNRLGMMIDLSYSSDTTARDVLSVTRAPVIFSHSGARQLCNSTRNVPDDILRLVAENGGLIMVSFDSEDVTCGRQARLKDVVDHIKYIRAIAGIQHIGLGAGYDGIELPPIGLEDVSKYPDLLAALLEDHNWSEEDIAMLAGKNFLRIMETVENVRDYWKRAAIQPIEQTEAQPKSQCAYMAS
ncbi:uncharacterized protein LOC142236168 [Haematobia irritans]|uniref:uncharacterized protein LOC142236168 n=1 Tax=Haematobia irritans TaxID=7368 RepID=UPI003F500C5C